MDGLITTRKNFPIVTAKFCERETRQANLIAECGNLITVLSRKIETFCNENEDTDRGTLIQSLKPGLLSLNSLVRRLEDESLFQPGNDAFEDTRGVRYRAVSHCDLERWFNEK